jgi:hypothetical protein
MTRSRRLLAALALAVAVGVSSAACQPVTEATIPAPPPCPPGQQWVALSTSHWGCAPDSGVRP